MTTPGRYAAADGSFARSTSNAAARGGALIAVAVVIGFLLLWKGGIGSGDDVAAIDAGSADDSSDVVDDGDDADAVDEDGDDDGEAADDQGDTTGDGDDAAGDDATGDDATTDTTPDTPTTRPLGEVKVVVANGVGEAGLAGARTAVLTTAGYVGQAANAATNPVEASAVYYLIGYDQDAAGVAAELGGDAVSVLQPAPVDPTVLVGDATGIEDFHIWVILGADRSLG